MPKVAITGKAADKLRRSLVIKFFERGAESVNYNRSEPDRGNLNVLKPPVVKIIYIETEGPWRFYAC